MGCGGFHGSAHPVAEAPLPALVHGQQPVLRGAEPTLHQTTLLASKPLLIQLLPPLSSQPCYS